MFTCPDCDSNVIPEKKGEHKCSQCGTKVTVKDDATVSSLDKGYERTIPRETRPVLKRNVRQVNLALLCMGCLKEYPESTLTTCQYTDGNLVIDKSYSRYHDGVGVWHHCRTEVIKDGKRVTGKLCLSCMTNPDLNAKPTYLSPEPSEVSGPKSMKGFNTRVTR